MIRVLHFSDIHVEDGFGGVPFRELASKRAIGYANLRLLRGPHFRDAIDKVRALVDLHRSLAIDLAIGTGDFTALGTHPELRLARELVEPMTRGRFGLVTMPGNHDVYLPDAVADARFDLVFGDLLRTDRPDLAVEGCWPQVRLAGEDLAVIAVNSARPNPEIVRSSGRIPDAQLAALDRAIRDPAIAGRFVIVATHYAPRLANGKPDRPTHGLDNADELLAVLGRLERGVLLHGHVHHRYHLRLPGLTIDVLNAGSTTHAGREGLWVLELEGVRGRAIPGRWDGTQYALEPEAAVSLGS